MSAAERPDRERELPPLQPDPVVLEFPDVERGSLPPVEKSVPGVAPLQGLLSVLIPAAMLAAACLPLLLILRRPAGLVGWVGGLALTVGLLWVVTSVLWPGRAERGCPECGEERLQRLDPETTVGVRCAACGFTDASRSSWLFAEEEGRPLEPAVLRERNRLPDSEPGASPDSGLDSGPGTN